MGNAKEASETLQPGTKKPCCRMCSKAYLIIFNVIFLLFGAAILGLGIWLALDEKSFLFQQIIESLPNEPLYGSIPYIMICVGSSMVLVCVAGACGACINNVFFLCAYAVILMIMLLIQIAIVIVAVVNKEKFEDHVTKTLLEQVQNSYNRLDQRDLNNTDFLTTAWDAMQVKLKCCGATGPDDYIYSAWWNDTRSNTGVTVPHTCCELYNDSPEFPMVRDNNQCQIEGFIYNKWKENSEEVAPPEDLHTKGCVVVVLEWIEQYSYAIEAILVSSAVLQLLGFITACLLIVWLRRHKPKSHNDE